MTDAERYLWEYWAGRPLTEDDLATPTLTDRERTILALRRGLRDGPSTQKGIAALLGISPARVSQLEHRARRRVRAARTAREGR